MNKYFKCLTEHRNCIICNKPYSDVWLDYGKIKLVKCNDCKLIWSDPYLSSDGVQIYYNEYSESYETKEKVKLRLEQYKMDRNDIEPFLSKNKKIKVLDVGCFDGDFLKLFETKRFDKFGFDIKEKESKNKNFFYGKFKDIPKAFKNFDLVMMRGVIQHVSSPCQYMEQISDMIKPKGLLYICATPNVDSFCAQVYKKMWGVSDPMAFMFYFSDKTAEKFLNKYGFQLIDKKFPYIDTPYCNLENDYDRILSDIDKIHNGKLPEKSPPFWGTMMNLVFKKVK